MKILSLGFIFQIGSRHLGYRFLNQRASVTSLPGCFEPGLEQCIVLGAMTPAVGCNILLRVHTYFSYLPDFGQFQTKYISPCRSAFSAAC